MSYDTRRSAGFARQPLRQPVPRPRRRLPNGHFLVTTVVLIAVVAGASLLLLLMNSHHGHQAVVVTNTPPNHCADNKLNQAVLVSISQRHLWACTANRMVYSAPVVTGMASVAADLTPTGTYHIYAKTTDLFLDGSDSTGSWHDHVSYWMPFLDNQYGTYGFHDATWRPANAFGHISPESSNASHGCVELPLTAAKWLYGWATVGATVIINS